MTLKDIVVTVGSAVGVTAILVTSIKVHELYIATVDTVDKLDKVVDTVYKHDADIDNFLNWMSKLPKTSPSKPPEATSDDR